MEISATYPVKGMHCASCAAIIEKRLGKMTGVGKASVNFGTENLNVVFDADKTSPQAFIKELAPLGYKLILPEEREIPAKDSKQVEVADLRGKVLAVMPLAAISVFIMGWDILAGFGTVALPDEILKEFFHHLLPLMATYTLFVTGQPYLKGLYHFLRHGAAGMDALIGLGTGAAYIYSFILNAFEEPLRPYVNVEHTYYDVTIVVIGFITLGKFLEARAKLRTGDAIQKLLGLQAKTALVVRNGKEIEIPVDQVVLNDIIVIKPGMKIPVDGVIESGSSYIGEAMVTGEPMPVAKAVGDAVIGGTLNTTGSFTFRATKIGADTLLAGIIRMVEAAQGSKAPIQALADKIAAVFVPAVLVIAFASLAGWLVFGHSLTYGLTAFVGALVIACPCALGLATPTAIIVGVGKGARNGILIKDAATLEKLAGVNTIVVDKTGTLTKGKPELVDIKIYAGISDNEILSILAGLEKLSEHPVAHAIMTAARERGIESAKVDRFEILKGKGLTGVVQGMPYFAGNARLMKEMGLSGDMADIDAGTAQGKTPVFLATEQAILALVWVADAVKPEAQQAVADLQNLDLDVVMLTGDSKNTAQYIATQTGIKTVIAEVLPQDKLMQIRDMQKSGRRVAMAGDGVNDAPALAQADVGIAMSTGTDVAIDTAGITLLHGDITKLAKAVRLSRQTMRGIRQNLFWAFAFNILGIPLAAGVFYPLLGWTLSPVFAGAAMAFSSVAVVSNSLRLKFKAL
jgi:Cu+-exporting ATPase